MSLTNIPNLIFLSEKNKKIIRVSYFLNAPGILKILLQRFLAHIPGFLLLKLSVWIVPEEPKGGFKIDGTVPGFKNAVLPSSLVLGSMESAAVKCAEHNFTVDTSSVSFKLQNFNQAAFKLGFFGNLQK